MCTKKSLDPNDSRADVAFALGAAWNLRRHILEVVYKFQIPLIDPNIFHRVSSSFLISRAHLVDNSGEVFLAERCEMRHLFSKKDCF